VEVLIKIYTPKQWESFFSSASIIIDGDGYIYDSDSYYALVKHNPIGLIDYETGKIYGADYAALTRAPIGKIIEDNGMKKIFGSDYAKIGAAPILYIDRNDRIYTAEEYVKLFGSPTGYIKQDGVATNYNEKSDTLRESICEGASKDSSHSGFEASLLHSVHPAGWRK